MRSTITPLRGISLSTLIISMHANAAGAAFAGELLRTIAALAIVLVAMVLSLFLVKKLRAFPSQNGRLKIIEVLPMGAKERLAIISVDGQELLIGIAAEHISLLTTLKTVPRSAPNLDENFTRENNESTSNQQKIDQTT
jgi:flagellar protein FliO/FliZ